MTVAARKAPDRNPDQKAQDQTAQDQAAGKGSRIAGFAADEQTAVALRGALGRRWPSALVLEGGIAAAMDLIARQDAPETLIVDIGEAVEPANAIRTLASMCPPEARIIALGSVNDVTLYRSLRNAGAADYLVKPVIESVVEAAIEQPVDDRAKNAAKRRARVIATIGARGGAGTTMLAVNMAWILSGQHQKEVALLDLDLHFGTTTLALDLEPSRGLSEAFAHAERIDSLFLSSAMASAAPHLSVLGGEEPLELGARLSDDALRVIIDDLRGRYDVVIIDVPRAVAVARPKMLAQANAVAIVTELNLPGMRDTLRLIEFARGLSPDASISVVANKVGKGGLSEVTEAEFERGLGQPIAFTLPFAAKAAAAANNSGRPVAELQPNDPLTQAISKAALQLADLNMEKKKPGLLDSLFHRTPKPDKPRPAKEKKG